MDMKKSVKDILYDTLQELLEEQFKDFKWKLPDITFDGKGKIAKGQVERAAKREVVDLMCHSYGEEGARHACISVLKNISRRDLAVKLEETTQNDFGPTQRPERAVHDCRWSYRKYIKEKFERMREQNSLPGEYVLLNHRYSRLIIIDHHREEEERNHEIMASGITHAQILKKRARQHVTIETLFNADENGFISQIVVLQGAAGIGKTMTAKKILLDWASEQLYQDKFDYVFYINCREMNLDTEMSIVEITSKQWAKSDFSKEILRNPEKLLFVIDGLDEIRFSIDQPEDCLCTDPWKKAPVRVLLSSLFLKKVLPESYFIITTRPTALEKLGQYLDIARYTEILGFSVEEREEYFHKFFPNKDEAKKAFRHVTQNVTLFTVCSVPLVCWITCTVLKAQLGQQNKSREDFAQTSVTLTGVYLRYLSSLLKSCSSHSGQCVQSKLRALCSFALDGIWKREILFPEDEIKQLGLHQDASLPLFLNENIFQRDVDCECAYSFVHLSFQEFFAALSYVLQEEDEPDSETPIHNLRTLLESRATSRPDLALTVRFLFGLLNEEKRMKDLKKRLGWENSPKIKEFLLEWLKNAIERKIKRTYFDGVQWLDCVFEIQDEHFVKRALNHVSVVRLKCDWLAHTEIMEMAYCLEHCCDLEELALSYNRLVMRKWEWDWEWEWGEEEGKEEDGEGVDEESLTHVESEGDQHPPFLGQFLKAMKSPKRSLWRLSLEKFELSRTRCEELSSLLHTLPRLSELKLDRCNVNNSEMKRLAEGLAHPDCTIQCLRLLNCSLTAASYIDLTKVLRESKRLKVLDLSGNYIKVKRMKLLCEGLKHPECKLEELMLSGCSLTAACCGELTKVLRESKRLKVLDLSDNHIKDKGMKLLCEGLKHPACKLEKLWLSNCSLTAACCGDLTKVLSERKRLKVLDMSRNEIEDKGMELFCEGIKNPESKLEELNVSCSSLPAACCGDLAEALSESKWLKALHLSGHDIEDKGMKLLCEGIKNSECQLEELKLSDCSLTAPCCSELAEVLCESKRLKVLDLYHITVEEKGLKLLCEGLKHPECKLEELKLPCCLLTAACCGDLAEVLSESKKLKVLDLSYDQLEDEGLKLLCEGLKRPECQLEVLRLSWCSLTAACCGDLAEVLRENKRLKVLDLSGNRVEDEGKKLLLEAQKHPDCKLEELILGVTTFSSSEDSDVDYGASSDDDAESDEVYNSDT